MWTSQLLNFSRVGMRPDLVLSEEEKKERFKISLNRKFMLNESTSAPFSFVNSSRENSPVAPSFYAKSPQQPTSTNHILPSDRFHQKFFSGLLKESFEESNHSFIHESYKSGFGRGDIKLTASPSCSKVSFDGLQLGSWPPQGEAINIYDPDLKIMSVRYIALFQ